MNTTTKTVDQVQIGDEFYYRPTIRVRVTDMTKSHERWGIDFYEVVTENTEGKFAGEQYHLQWGADRTIDVINA